jgi:hypothetical protein
MPPDVSLPSLSFLDQLGLQVLAGGALAQHAVAAGAALEIDLLADCLFFGRHGRRRRVLSVGAAEGAGQRERQGRQVQGTGFHITFLHVHLPQRRTRLMKSPKKLRFLCCREIPPNHDLIP